MTCDVPRILRFIGTGGVCFSVQCAGGAVLSRSGVPWPAANATGFAASAQLNFLLSSGWTWRDRRPPRRAGLVFWRRWASYNATALMALVLNTVAFTLTYERIGALPAALAGVAFGTVLTYLLCDLAVFRGSRTLSSGSS